MQAANTDKLNLLVVDDHHDVIAFLQRALRNQPYHVRTVTSAADALAMMKESPADLVLTDIRMPGMSGLELMEHITSEYPHTVMVVMTGFPDMDTAIKTIHHGGVDFLMKPVDVETLTRTLQRAADKYRTRLAHAAAGRAGDPLMPTPHITWRAALDCATVGVAVLDNRGRLAFGNTAFGRLFNIPAGTEASGRDYFQLFARVEDANALRAAWETRKPWQAAPSMYVAQPPGRHATIHLYADPVILPDGQSAGLIVFHIPPMAGG